MTRKQQVRAAILERLREEFESRLRVSKQTRELGSNAESKAEGKYDTLAIEENYLADGLARQAQSAAIAAAEIENMPLPAFGEGDVIDLGALVEVRFSDSAEWFFLAPGGGGTEVCCDGISITVVTPESPLGGQLDGARVGDTLTRPDARILQVM